MIYHITLKAVRHEKTGGFFAWIDGKEELPAAGGDKPKTPRRGRPPKEEKAGPTGKEESLDSWAAALEAQKPPRKRGGQPGNKNAAGAGPPTGNRNAETHGAYSAVRMEDLTPEQRAYIEKITLDTKTNMLAELQLLIAKEFDLQNKIAKLENAQAGSLFVDRVVEVQTPKGQERLNQQLEKLASLQAEEEALRWDVDVQQGKPPTKQQQKRLESLQREIAALQDTTGDRARELEQDAYNTATRTVIQWKYLLIRVPAGRDPLGPDGFHQNVTDLIRKCCRLFIVCS